MSHPPIRVLLVSSSSGSQGGGELYLDGLAGGLRSLGHEVESLLADHPRMDALAEKLGRWGRVHRVPYRNTYDRFLRSGGAVLARRSIARLARRFAALGPDVLHVNKQNVEDGLDLLQAASRSRLPCVATVHNTRGMAELGSWGGRLRDRIAAHVLASARCDYIAVAGAGARQILSYARGAIDPSRVHTVWNGIGEAPPADRAAVRAAWGCGDGDFVLGCVARLEAEKDPLFLVSLLPCLPSHIHLAWVGDGRLREQFLAAAEGAGVRHRVHFDGWRADARQRMAGFDLFVMPSLYEGFPFAPLEAMAAGLPCVVSDVDGTREAIDDGVSGWLCPARDRGAWLGRLGGLIADPGLRARVGGEGRRRVAEHFSLAAMARRTAAVYERVLAARATPTPLQPAGAP
jgi:glycosyltransferase involved in cell wall biosynthesis